MMNEKDKELKDYGLSKSLRREKRIRENKEGSYDHYCHGFYNKTYRFLEKNVGRPYKKVYGEFCALFPSQLDKYTNTRSIFRKACGIDNRHYHPYYVTPKGIIKKTESHKEQKTITVGYKQKPLEYYEFNKVLLKYPDIANYFNTVLGYKNVREIMHTDTISKKILDMLEKKIRSDGYYDDFLSHHRQFKKNGGWIYRKVVKSEPILVKEGTREYNRERAEMLQSLRTTYRNLKAIQKGQIATLLHDLEERAKAREALQNTVDRDRLGFDENSFIGEPYHGQKRKKK